MWRARERASVRVVSDVVYFSAVQIAQLVRADLKRIFPRVKFSVTSQRYSLGSSVHVRWDAGPAETEVRDLIGRYATGAYFDGLDEYHEQRYFIHETPYGTRRAYGVNHVILHRRKSADES